MRCLLPAVLSVLALAGVGASEMDDSANELARRIREGLPPGWVVLHNPGEMGLTVSTEKAYMAQEEGGAFGGGATFRKFAFTFRFLPYLTLEEYRKRIEENDGLRQQANALYLGWGDRVDNPSESEDSPARGQVKEMAEKERQYWRLKKAVRQLPEYSFKRLGIVVYRPYVMIQEPGKAAECRQVFERAKALLTAYPKRGHSALRFGSPETITELMGRMREVVPAGWEVVYLGWDETPDNFAKEDGRYSQLTVIRKAAASFVRLRPGEESASEMKLKCRVSFRVFSLLPVEAHDQIERENVRYRKESAAAAARLRELGVEGDGMSFSPKGDKEQLVNDRYESLERLIQTLPDFYYRDISLSWRNDPEKDGLTAKDPAVAKECREVREKVVKLLTAY